MAQGIKLAAVSAQEACIVNLTGQGPAVSTQKATLDFCKTVNCVSVHLLALLVH